ncbi:hypothetical protein [Aeromonas veronii]|uniref:hypothetical protein n=1 Tax=Aeromonas veronii TaxID=654 RepID=UPI003D1BED5C
MNLKFSANKVLTLIVSIWLLVSSIYYIDNLFSGSFSVEYSANLFKNSIKYVVITLLSIAIVSFSGKGTSFIVHVFTMLLIVTALLVCALNENLDLKFGINLLVIFFSFFGMVFIIESWECKYLIHLRGVIIFSGVVIGFFSIYEWFFLYEVMSPYWNATGGYRSVSTLLNPNNMGLYVSAVLILTIHSDLSVCKKLILIPIFISLIIVSGSRTAALSLLLSFLFLKEIRRNFILIPLFMVLFILFFILYKMDLLYGRAVDMTTATIRLEKYFNYVINIDVIYLLPDFSMSRFEWVSESAYLHMLNSLGGFITFVLGFVFYGLVFMGKIGRTQSVDVVHLKLINSFKHVFIFYIIASIFEGVFTSFPNNQLLFISMGALFFSNEINSCVENKEGGQGEKV